MTSEVGKIPEKSHACCEAVTHKLLLLLHNAGIAYRLWITSQSKTEIFQYNNV